MSVVALRTHLSISLIHKAVVCFTAFFTALHFALPLYVYSPYLNKFLPKTYIGFAFAAAAVLSLLALLNLPRLLAGQKARYTLLWLFSFQIAVMLNSAFPPHPAIAVISFLSFWIIIEMIIAHLDILLEGVSKDKNTGYTRGAYLFAVNLGILSAPLLMSRIIEGGSYWVVFVASELALIPALLLICGSPRLNLYIEKQKSRSVLADIKHALHRRNVARICISNFLLNMFYATMIVYTPLYLISYIGFSLKEIGVIFTIMLLPFVALQWPLGHIADRKFGEKELLAAGFIIITLATGLISFQTSAKFLPWMLILLATRIGASIVEVMNESYFFKQIARAEANFISLFRATRPAGYIAGTAFASFFLLIFDMRHLFATLGAIMLSGVWVAWKLKDTR